MNTTSPDRDGVPCDAGNTATTASTPALTLLFGAWGVSANDVWAVGWGGVILHWNGSSWSSISSGTTDALGGVWGSGASDVWVVGGSGKILHHQP